MVWRAVDADTLSRGFRDRVPPLIGPVQVLVSVPKKRRKKAVDRVLMRRRIREAYRASAMPMISKINEIDEVRTLSLALIYSKENNAPYCDVLEDVEKLLSKLIRKLEKIYLTESEETERDSDLGDDTAD